MEKPITPLKLDEIRSEIDAMDRAILELLEKRFAAIELIKQWKQLGGSNAASPVRPAREAEIVRGLHRLRGSLVPSELMVRLWRSIIAAATAVQAKVTIHMAKEVGDDLPLRDLVRDHFAGLALCQHRSASEAVAAAEATMADIAVASTVSDWIAPLAQHRGMKVIGVLPVVWERRKVPELVVLGQVKAEPTGEDETLVAVGAGHEAPAKTLWTAKAGEFSCIALEGFLEENSADIVQLRRSGREAMILGRCPAPIEAQR